MNESMNIGSPQISTFGLASMIATQSRGIDVKDFSGNVLSLFMDRNHFKVRATGKHYLTRKIFPVIATHFR